MVKRFRKKTVYHSVEGETELALLEHLKEIYSPAEQVSFTQNPTKGGNPDALLQKAIEAQDRIASFAWIDEDKPLSEDSRKKLVSHWKLKPPNDTEILTCPLCDIQQKYNIDKRNPILLVSKPICVDALILRILEETLPHTAFDPTQREKQILDSKNALKGLRKKLDLKTFFENRLTRDHLEKVRAEIFELNMLITLISPP